MDDHRGRRQQSVLLFAAVIEGGELMRFGERRFHSEGRGEKFELSVSERFANALDCRANTHSLLRPSPTPESCPDRGEIKQNRSLIGRERRFPQFWQKIRRNGEIMRARTFARHDIQQTKDVCAAVSLPSPPLHCSNINGRVKRLFHDLRQMFTLFVRPPHSASAH